MFPVFDQGKHFVSEHSLVFVKKRYVCARSHDVE